MPERPESKPEHPGTGRRHRFALPRWAWWSAAVIVAVITAFLVVSRRRELVEAFHLIAEVSLPRLAVGAVLQAASLVCLGAVFRWLLRAGGTRWSLRRWMGIMLGANALAGAVPGGAALATAWTFRQLRRRGVEEVLAAAVLVVAGTLSAFGLGLLVVAGLLTAGSKGSAAVVHPVVGVLVAILVLAALVFCLLRFADFRARAGRTWTDLGRQYARVGEFQKSLDHLVSQVHALNPGFRPWLVPATLALLNWVLDAACLVACMWALNISPPWHGVLLAFALTQIPGSLRLTPGGLGLVEATMAALLVLYGMQAGPAIAATLLYRFLGYWVLQLVGWACWFVVSYQRVDASGARPAPR